MSEIQPPPYQAPQPPPYQPNQTHPAQPTPDVIQVAYLERIAADVRGIRQWVGFWSVLGVIGVVMAAIALFTR